MPRELHTYTLPTYWASYLVNGDGSGYEDEEIAEIDEWMKRMELPAPCDVDLDNAYFTHGHCANRNQGADVCVYSFLIITPPDPEEQAELRRIFKPAGGKQLTNFGGIELMFDQSGEAVYYRYNYGEENIDQKEIYTAEIEQEWNDSEDEDTEFTRDYFMDAGTKYYLDEFMRYAR